MIDEAQNLDPQVLEQVRLISNLETKTDKLIQIVLAGQPELGQLLNRAELRQIAQRITVSYHLTPSTSTTPEPMSSIAWKLRAIGGRLYLRRRRSSGYSAILAECRG